MSKLLAQDSGYSDAFVWSAVILGLCLAMFFLVSFVRKKIRSDIDDTPVTGFTLSDLRELHRSGQMSAEEFEKAKAKLLEATKAAAAAKSAPSRDRPTS